MFKLMKKKGPFEWTEEADKAFQDLKRYLTSPPMMVDPCPREPLVLYLAATPTPPAQPWWRLERSVGTKPRHLPMSKRSGNKEDPQRLLPQPRSVSRHRRTHSGQRRPLPLATSHWGLPCLRRRHGLRRAPSTPALPTLSNTLCTSSARCCRMRGRGTPCLRNSS